MTAAGFKSDPTFSQRFMDGLAEREDGERIWKCIQCGTCAGVCPLGSWMEFTPRKAIAALREHVFDEVMQSEAVWLCVSCYACTSGCPQQIPLTAALMTHIKEEMVLAGKVPAELQSALEKTQRYGNPLGESARRRADWTKGIGDGMLVLSKAKQPVDVLWFVGDYASYHPRAQLAVKALAGLFEALDVSFGILGPEEVSDGDSQRLAGENGLFQMLAEKNGRAFGKYEFNQIVTSDPHAYNALKNEYPRLGFRYPVQHYTQFLWERLDQLRPLLKREVNALVAYHDPCYLGRVNGIYEEPRELLEAIPGVVLVEMSHSKSNSLCCGGGGGGMWLDGFQWERAGIRMSEWRVQEALEARSEFGFATAFELVGKSKSRPKKVDLPAKRVLAVACPYEAPRFEDAAKALPGAKGLLVRDIAELLLEAMDV